MPEDRTSVTDDRDAQVTSTQRGLDFVSPLVLFDWDFFFMAVIRDTYDGKSFSLRGSRESAFIQLGNGK